MYDPPLIDIERKGANERLISILFEESCSLQLILMYIRWATEVDYCNSLMGMGNGNPIRLPPLEITLPSRINCCRFSSFSYHFC